MQGYYTPTINYWNVRGDGLIQRIEMSGIRDFVILWVVFPLISPGVLNRHCIEIALHQYTMMHDHYCDIKLHIQ